MTHGSLESGIGMFDYAAEQIGWENVFHCEINTFCRTVLNYYWPKAKSYANVFGFDGYEWRGKVDVITAGFPCQPFSHAGKREGSKDDRHIWPENMRIFREAQPTFIVCENVPGLLTIEGGMVFEQVCLDLENEGYEVQTYIIPACATDKDHRRDRLWIIAHSDGIRDDTNTFNQRLQKPERTGACGQGARPSRSITEPFKNENWLEAATRLCSVDDGYAGDIHVRTLQNANSMDRLKLIEEILKAERIKVDFETGKIYSLVQRNNNGTPIELNGTKRKDYIHHNLYFNGCKKSIRAHQIIWVAANGIYSQETHCIDHINRNPSDNRLANLRLVTYSENNLRKPVEQVLSAEEKKEMVALYHQGNNSIRELAEDFGISKSRVHQILHETSPLDTTTISKSKWRTESLKAYGNTIVWEIAFEIFKAIEQYERIRYPNQD